MKKRKKDESNIQQIDEEDVDEQIEPIVKKTNKKKNQNKKKKVVKNQKSPSKVKAQQNEIDKKIQSDQKSKNSPTSSERIYSP